MKIKEPGNEAERQAFAERLPYSLMPLMSASDSRGILLGAWAGECLIGRLAAMAATNDPEVYKLLFLLPAQPPRQISRAWTALEVETALLSEFESRVRLLGYRKLVMQPIFLVGTNQLSLLDSLRLGDWQEIRHISTKFYIEGYGVLQERWFHKPLPPGYEIFFWRDLTSADREYLVSRGSEAGYLDPLRVEDFEPETSLGLRNTATGQVAGWFVNERADACTICLSKLYLFPEERSQACFYPLIAQSVRYLWQHNKGAVMAVNADNPRMRAALTKMTARHCRMIVDCYYCEKVLL